MSLSLKFKSNDGSSRTPARASRGAVGSLARMVLLSGMVALSASACISTNTYSSGRTLKQGKIETRISPGFTRSSLTDLTLPVVPGLDVGIMYGVNGNFDFGVSVGSDGFTFDTKFQLARNKNLAIALAPSLGGFFIGGANAGGGFFNAGVPLIVGLNLNEHTELTLTPKLSLSTAGASYSSNGGSGTILVPSLGIGLNLEIGPSFHLMPEASFGTATIMGGGSSEQLGPVISVGLGIGFGGEYAR